MAKACPKPDSCCKVESLLSVDERGQMVLPKEIRERADISSGEKLALLSCEQNGKIYCLMLMKTEGISGLLKDLLAPVMQGIIEK